MVTEADEWFAAYEASMPAEYREAFDVDARRAHEAIVRRRGTRSTHIEVWRELDDRVVAVCVVANDKPGLLSRISAALVSEQFDVVGAHAYCRTRDDGASEAVDLLWIRRLPGEKSTSEAVRAEDIAALCEAIERANANVAVPSVPPPASGGARVRFETDEKEGVTMLTVEAVDRPGLLLAVTQALFRADIQIVGLRATTERGSAVDRFKLADAGGKPLRKERLFDLQIAILSAIEEGTLTPERKKTAGS